MSYFSPLAAAATPYTPGEQPRDRRYIKLNTNENAYPPSPHVAEAIARAAGGLAQSFEALRLYPDPNGRALKQTLASLHGVPEDHVFVGNGSDEVLALAFAAFFAQGRVVAPAVSYSFYPVYAQLFGATYVPAPMRGLLEVDVEALLDAEAPVVLANPNAPTSRALTADVLADMARRMQARGHVLLVDEAYEAFGQCSVVDQTTRWDNLLVVRTLSKSHALAGLRVGYAIGQPALMEGLERIKNCFNSYTLDQLAICGAQAALEDVAYTEAHVHAICVTRDAVAAQWRTMGMTVLPSKANFLFVRKDGVAGKALFQALRAAGILVRHFDTPQLTDFLRVTIGTQEQMNTVTSELVKILDEYARKNV